MSFTIILALGAFNESRIESLKDPSILSFSRYHEISALVVSITNLFIITEFLVDSSFSSTFTSKLVYTSTKFACTYSRWFGTFC